MKKTLSIIILIIAMFIGLINVNNVYAANSQTFTISIVSEKSAVQGGELPVTIQVSDFTAGLMIQDLEFDLKFDTAIFDAINRSDIRTSSEWDIDSFTEKNNGEYRIGLYSGTFVSSNSDVLSFTLKLKENANLGSTSLELLDIDAYDDASNIAAIKGGNSVTTSITIQASAVATPTPVITSTPKTTAKTTTPTTTAKSDEKMPKTGVEDYIMPAIVVIAVAGIVAYVRFNKMDK